MGQAEERSAILARFHELSVDMLGTASIHDGTWQSTNPAFTRILGWSEHELVGRPFFDIVHPDDVARSRNAVGELARGAPLKDFEHRCLCKDGSIRWIAWHTAALAEEGLMYCIGRDVTSRRIVEARRAVLLKLGDALRPLADTAEIQGVASRLLGEHLGVARVRYGEIPADDEDGPGGLPAEAGSGAAWFRPVDFGPAINAKLRAGCTVALADVGAEPFLTDTERDGYAARNVRALAVVPLIKKGRYAAVLYLEHDAPRPWTTAELALVEEVAERTWAAVERARAEAALRDSEARLAGIFESLPVAAGVVDARGRLTVANQEMRRYMPQGIMPSQLGSDDLPWRAWSADGRPLAPHEFPGARALRGEHVVPGLEMLFRAEDGREIWTTAASVPLRNHLGRLIGAVTVIADIDARKRAEVGLAHSEQRLRSLVEGVPQLVWRSANLGDWTWASPQWVAFTGQAEPDSHRRGWLDPVHPDDRAAALAAWDEAPRRGALAVDFRVRNAATGQYRWMQTRATPLRDGAGTITEWLGTSTDVHDLRELQDRQQVLVAELQHRTRNLMGVVRSTFEATFRAEADLAEFAAKYRDRLNALARVQGLLSRLNTGDRVTFGELIRSELTAMGALGDGEGRVTLTGPEGVALRSSTVQTFALALHELATNATKYGALAQAAGRLAVTWWLVQDGADGRPWLHVDWRESGVVMPAADTVPHGTGQGRQLIEKALPYQLGATTTYVMGSDGVRCSIAVPVSSRTIGREAGDGRATAS